MSERAPALHDGKAFELARFVHAIAVAVDAVDGAAGKRQAKAEDEQTGAGHGEPPVSAMGWSVGRDGGPSVRNTL